LEQTIKSEQSRVRKRGGDENEIKEGRRKEYEKFQRARKWSIQHLDWFS